MAYFQLIGQERQQRNTKRNFSWLSSGNIVCHRGTCLDQIITQFIGEDGQWTCTIMFKETHIDIRVPGKSSIGNKASNVLTIVVSEDKDAIPGCHAHAAYGIFSSEQHSLFKRERLQVSFLCYTWHHYASLSNV